jgi:CheY-like chemotaxis protein
MQTQNKRDRITVLFVDDNAEFLKSAKQCLLLHGSYEIETALSVDEALKKMEKSKPDAIICDLQMPITDGFEFLKTLRENDDNTPFIVFTIAEEKEKALRAFRLGANGFVGKSGDPEVVFSTLQKCIDKSISEA